ncbi:MAG: hypothetical protein DMF84_09160 [Acidobacteria bacterium]|nr:MAG: hypothetical protein DMF84_09160 [Acidobacteriota bacterium]
MVYQVQDPEFFATATRFKDLEPAVVFEAIAESGVVLGSGMTVFRLANGGASGAASVKITGLSEGALQKLWLVRARWQYGKS